MKLKTIIFFSTMIILVFFLQCQKDTTPLTPGVGLIPDTTQVPLIIRKRYSMDAARLTVRYMLTTPDSDRVELNQRMVDRVYLSLISIYLSAEKISACDSVTRKYEIHTFYNPPLQEILVMLDTSYAWTHAWLQYNPFTGNPVIDSLVQKYQIAITDVNTGWDVLVVLKSNILINTLALCKKFRIIPGILSADPNWAFGDGHDITYEKKNGKDLFTFTLKWGDCPAGCIYHHSWHFLVTDNYSVEYMGSSGSPISDEEKIKIKD